MPIDSKVKEELNSTVEINPRLKRELYKIGLYDEFYKNNQELYKTNRQEYHRLCRNYVQEKLEEYRYPKQK